MSTLRILIADDHDVVRQGLRALLETQPGWEICGEAATGRETVEKTRKLKPDIVLLDIIMPELNGLEALRRIRKARPETQVLVLTMHESEDLIGQALKAGARGFMLKSDAGRDLITAIDGNKISFTQAADTFIRDMTFSVSGNTLVGDQTFGTAHVHLTLTRANTLASFRGPAWVNGGLYAFAPALWAELPSAGGTAAPCSLEREILPALAARGSLRGLKLPGEFFDIGTPEEWERAERAFGA